MKRPTEGRLDIKSVGLCSEGGEQRALMLVAVFDLLVLFNDCCLYVIVSKVLTAGYDLRPKGLQIIES